MGYTQVTWDNLSGKERAPWSSAKSWAQLSANEKEAAALLGYTQQSWDNESGSEQQPHSSFKSWRELTKCGEGEGVFLPFCFLGEAHSKLNPKTCPMPHTPGHLLLHAYALYTYVCSPRMLYFYTMCSQEHLKRRLAPRRLAHVPNVAPATMASAAVVVVGAVGPESAGMKSMRNSITLGVKACRHAKLKVSKFVCKCVWSVPRCLTSCRSIGAVLRIR